MSKKPTGITGPYKVSINSGQVTGQQEKIAWPSDQKEIERKILEYFIREFEKSGAKFLDVKDGGTKELDFLVTTPNGKAYIELMEVVLADHDQNPYQKGTQVHSVADYARKIFENVKNKKIKKYGFNHQTPIDLLLYVTHEQYSPNESAIQALRHYFKENKHPFSYIFFLTPLAEDLIILQVLFNKDFSFETPPLEELEKNTWINLPSSNAKIITQF